jgi:HK97 family phage major capsid protein
MDNKNTVDRGSEEYRALFSKYMRKGGNFLTAGEARALSQTGAAGSGDVLAPTEFADKFMSELGDDQIISRVSKLVVNSGVVSVPVISPTGSGGFSVQKNPGEAGTLIDATTTGQAQVSVPTIALPGTSTSGTGTSTLRLRRVSVMVRVSNELLEDSAGQGEASIESLIISQAAQDIASILNKQILVGNKDDNVTSGTASVAGSDCCHGVFNTCRRYSRAYTSTQIFGTNTNSLNSANNAVNWVSGQARSNRMAPHYWNRSVIVFNSQLNANTAGNEGTRLFSNSTMQQAMTYGAEGRTVLGLPWTFADMSVNNTGDNGPTNSNEPLSVICDFSRYLLVSTTDGVTISRVTERFVDTNETMFVVALRCAGILLDPNAALALMV